MQNCDFKPVVTKCMIDMSITSLIVLTQNLKFVRMYPQQKGSENKQKRPFERKIRCYSQSESKQLRIPKCKACKVRKNLCSFHFNL